MKWVLRILGGLLGLILLGCVAFAALPWWPVLSDSMGAKPYLQHLRENATLDPTTETLRLDEKAYGPGFVILGELHGFSTPQAFDEMLALHLAGEAGMRWYLAELDPMQAMIVNAYLDTGDDTELRAIFDRWADDGVQWANREFFAKFERLRSAMLSNPDHAFRFIGIDQPQHEVLFEGLDPELGLPILEPSLNTLDDAEAINLTLAAAAAARNGGRYAHMLENLKLLSAMDGFSDQTFYGLWGLFHSLQSPASGSEPLAMRLNAEGGIFEGRVTSILTMCVQNCYNMMAAAALPTPLQSPDGAPYTILPMAQDNPYFLRYSGNGELINAMDDAATALFRIDTEESPYLKPNGRLVDQSGYLEPVFSFPIEGSAAQTFDYVFAMRNVEALNPWKGDAFDITRQK